jgi:hypothetical protein
MELFKTSVVDYSTPEQGSSWLRKVDFSIEPSRTAIDPSNRVSPGTKNLRLLNAIGTVYLADAEVSLVPLFSTHSIKGEPESE